MKRFFAFLLAIIMCLSCMLLVGCGKEQENDTSHIVNTPGGKYDIEKGEYVTSPEEYYQNVPQTEHQASEDRIKQVVIDYYYPDSLPDGVVRVEHTDWEFTEITKLTDEKYRIKANFQEWEYIHDGSGVYSDGYCPGGPDEITINCYVIYYPETDNYDIAFS